MKERIKNDLPMLMGVLLGLTIIETISDGSFSVINMLLRILTITVVYSIFRFVEFKRKKKKERK